MSNKKEKSGEKKEKGGEGVIFFLWVIVRKREKEGRERKNMRVCVFERERRNIKTGFGIRKL